MSFAKSRTFVFDYSLNETYMLDTSMKAQNMDNFTTPLCCLFFPAMRLRDNKLCEIKIIPTSYSNWSFFQAESQYLTHSKHKHVAEVIGLGTGSLIFPDENWRKTCFEVNYISSEHLYDFWPSLSQSNEEGIADETIRSIIKKLVKTVRFLDMKGLAIRNLSPYKMKFSASGTLKLSGIGLIPGMHENSERLVLYHAPEIRDNKFQAGYQPWMSAVYTMGIILAEMRFGPGLLDTVPLYPWCCDTFQTDGFWENCELFSRNSFDPSLRLLLKAMLQSDPLKRATIPRILSDPWVCGNSGFDEIFEGIDDLTHI